MAKKKYPAVYVVESRYEGNKEWDYIDFCWTRKDALNLFKDQVEFTSEKIRILKYNLEGVIKES